MLVTKHISNQIRSDQITTTGKTWTTYHSKHVADHPRPRPVPGKHTNKPRSRHDRSNIHPVDGLELVQLLRLQSQ